MLYRVTPLYNGNDLVATGIEIEAYSVEDDGAGICFNVFIYNSQPGIKIDYATGESYLVDKDISSDGEIREGLLEETVETQEYVLNLNTRKYHLSTCPSVDDIKEKIRKMLYAAEKK